MSDLAVCVLKLSHNNTNFISYKQHPIVQCQTCNSFAVNVIFYPYGSDITLGKDPILS